MYITTLMEVGQIYLVLIQGWKEGKMRITIKNGQETPFENILIDTKNRVDNIYKYLLENWATKRLQIFLLSENPT